MPADPVIYYDLARSPPTYDFVSFLVGAEMDRIKAGWPDFEIIVLPGPADGFRKDNYAPFGAAAREAMLASVVMPMPILLPTCRGVVRLRERPAPAPQSIGYHDGRYGFERKVAAAKAGIYPLRALQGYRLPKVPYATITLRECEHWPTRNSNIDEWTLVADGLVDRGITPIFIRDTARCTEAVPGYLTHGLAAVDLHTRAAFYAGAVMNFFVNNGPAWLSWFMGAPTLISKMCSPGAPVVNVDFFRACGLEPGSDLPNARPRQRILWEDDRSDLVLDCFDELIDQPRNPPPRVEHNGTQVT